MRHLVFGSKLIPFSVRSARQTTEGTTAFQLITILRSSSTDPPVVTISSTTNTLLPLVILNPLRILKTPSTLSTNILGKPVCLYTS